MVLPVFSSVNDAAGQDGKEVVTIRPRAWRPPWRGAARARPRPLALPRRSGRTDAGRPARAAPPGRPPDGRRRGPARTSTGAGVLLGRLHVPLARRPISRGPELSQHPVQSQRPRCCRCQASQAWRGDEPAESIPEPGRPHGRQQADQPHRRSGEDQGSTTVRTDSARAHEERRAPSQPDDGRGDGADVDDGGQHRRHASTQPETSDRRSTASRDGDRSEPRGRYPDAERSASGSGVGRSWWGSSSRSGRLSPCPSTTSASMFAGSIWVMNSRHRPHGGRT